MSRPPRVVGLDVQAEPVEALQRAGLAATVSARRSRSPRPRGERRTTPRGARLAVTCGSIWRSEPAPLLRGLAYSGRPGLLALGVDARELGLGHEDLAARLDVDRLGQLLGHGLDRAQVGRDVLAGRAIAARGALDKAAAAVADAHREAVDLQLGDVAQLARRVLLGHAQQPPDACVEGAHLVVREGVVERQHRHRVLDLGELAGRRAAHALGRRIGRDQLGMGFLEVDELAIQLVVLGVLSSGRVLLVVQPIGAVDLFAQLGGSSCRVGGPSQAEDR